jgi:hypothetical protein
MAVGGWADDRDWKSLHGYRSAALKIPTQGRDGFTLMAASNSGVSFSNRLAQTRSLTNQIFLNGSGVAAGDVDGDGWCDLYFCALDNPNELYRNLGNWKFESIPGAGGAACADQASTGAAFADLDGDGDLDLLVNGIARGTRLFQNDGTGSFREITATSGLQHNGGAMSLAIADVNGDGLLDIYVVNYRSSTFRDEPEKRFRALPEGGRYVVSMVDGRPVTEPDLIGRFTIDPTSGLMENGEADILFINQGGGKFQRVDWRGGTFLDDARPLSSAPYDWGLSAMFRDLNGDGAPDLYVCNDFQSPDRIWINAGGGKFRSAPANALRQTSLFSMGADFADLDGDGHEEFFVADMLSRQHERLQTQVMDGTAAIIPDRKLETRPQYTRNTLFWNRGDGTYAEVAQLAGLDATEWSWSPAFIDVDLDGRRDLLVTTGHERDAQHIDVAREIEQAKLQKASWRQLMEMRRKFPRLASPILAYRNKGELTFEETTGGWGFTTEQIAHGLALVDLDNDGDLDLAVNCLNSPALLYRNESSKPRLAIQLRGRVRNTFGVGARISVTASGLPVQTDQVIAAGRYLSADAFTRTFAAGAASTLSVKVLWPDGKISSVTNAAPNSIIEIFEETATTNETHPSTNTATFFQDNSAELNHRHHDAPFDDFQRQHLLPRKFSELGPAVAWYDFDDDGWEDLFIGGGRGGKLAVYKNNRGKLAAVHPPQFGAANARDDGGLLGWSHGTNRFLLAVSSNYEDAQTNQPALRQIHLAGTNSTSLFPSAASTSGALSLGDADADGDLDLFIAGRIVPGLYPAPAESIYLRNDGGSFKRDPNLNNIFASVGLVSAATWSDLSGDGKPELLLALDGGPIRVFSFRGTEFRELTHELGLDQFVGWWQSITTGDFNNDGRMDLVAGNLGRNSKYQRFKPDRYTLYYGEIAGGMGMHLIESFRDGATERILPLMDRDSLALTLPGIAQHYPTFASFAKATVPEIVGEQFRSMKEIRVNVTESMLFINVGSKFRAQPLPLAAQLSPVFALSVGDIDADGNQDLFLNQNLFSVGKNTSRYDAGEGVLMLGDGTGNLTPIPSRVSGIKLEGEGRGAAFCDFNHDGRLDLVSAQNSGPTKLYRNAIPSSGLRVSANSGPANPHGVGVTIRARYHDGRRGPAQEIRAGDGYWSQSSPTLIVATNSPLRDLEVRWSTGELQQFPIDPNQQEFVLRKGSGK